MNWKREPALIIGVIGAALSLVVSLGFDWMTAEQAALIIAVLNGALGVANAIAVRPIAPPAFTDTVGAVASLAAAYGFNVAQDTVGAVNGLVLAVLVLLTRGQVTPAKDPRTIDGTTV